MVEERLREMEAQVESGYEQAEEGLARMGFALREIRDGNLYKQAGFGTWAKYAKERWGWSARHCDRLIEFAQLTERLGPIGPKKESHARLIAPFAKEVEDDELVAVVRGLRERYGADFTAEKLEKVMGRNLERAKQNSDEKALLVDEATGIDERREAGLEGDHPLHHGDCLELIPDPEVIEDGSVYAIVTDPPYGTDDEGGRGEVRHGKIEGNSDLRTATTLLRKTLKKLEPKMAQDAWAAIFCDPRYVAQFREVVEGSGYLRASEYPLVWWKIDAGQPVRNSPYRSATESVVLARKGKPNWGPPGGGIGNVIACKKLPWQRKDFHHFHEKPLGLMAKLVRDLVPGEGLVVDPFAGSGTTLVAATLLGRRSVGMEKDNVKFAAAYKRIAMWRDAPEEKRRKYLAEALESVILLNSIDPVGEWHFDRNGLPVSMREQARRMDEAAAEIERKAQEAFDKFVAIHGYPPPMPSAEEVLEGMLEQLRKERDPDA
jgi:site-specific DNA-methyltransferase (adenine-specific)